MKSKIKINQKIFSIFLVEFVRHNTWRDLASGRELNDSFVI